MNEFTCRKCGTINQQGKFCSECGARKVETTDWGSTSNEVSSESNATAKRRKRSSKPAALRVASITDQDGINYGTLGIGLSALLLIAVLGSLAFKPIFATIKNQKLWKDYETSRKSVLGLADEMDKASDSSTNTEQNDEDSTLESEKFPVGAVFEIPATKDNAFLLFSDLYAVKEYLSAQRAGDDEGISKLSYHRVHWVMENVQVRVLEDDSRAQHIGLLRVRVIGSGSGYDRNPAGFVYTSQLRKFFQQ